MVVGSGGRQDDDENEAAMTIDVNTKTIGELAMESPRAIAVMERWEIDYCCHHNRSVAEACLAAGVATADLLRELDEPRPPLSGGWDHKPLADLQRYIIDTHHAYTRQSLETVSLLADKVLARHGAAHAEIAEVHRLVFELATELLMHMKREEDIVFPQIQAMERGAEPSATNGVQSMMVEHEGAGEILAALRQITAGYALPGDACLSYRALYERLTDLEADLREHFHLENDVLFPSVIRLGQQPLREMRTGV
ncbi:MAG TPA: iron-sulfur cluster repair di-iron protein [Thermoanaerobaculia bacterium]|nr:iron-sulfur cluster repair di-iron protein [Thermoanaerobaculia bacterium]